MNLYGFAGNDGVNIWDVLGLQAWARLTINESKRYQIDLTFDYKICSCDENNKDLEGLSTDEITKFKNTIETSMKSFEKTREKFAGVTGTLKIWPNYVGNADGSCEVKDTEIENSKSDPYFNIIFAEAYQGSGSGSASVSGDYAQVMELSIGMSERTLRHELGHMISYEHPHNSNPDNTKDVFKNDIMVQLGNDSKTGQGTESHPGYMWSLWIYLKSNQQTGVHGFSLINPNAIMKR